MTPSRFGVRSTHALDFTVFDSPVLEDHATVSATCFPEMQETIMAARASHLIHQPVVSDEDCLKYRGQWVAVAMTDGRILASGNTVLEVAKVVDDLGISWRDYLLEPIPSADILEWRATVAFAPKRGTHPLLGFAGVLQFFDATFSGEHEEVTLTPNTLLPSHAPTSASP